MRSAFTKLELLVVLLTLTATVAALLPILGKARRSARSMQSNNQLRGVHQSCFSYSQGNGNYFPGYNDQGLLTHPSTAARFELLLANDFFTGEYAISPVETRTLWTQGPVTPEHYSFALPDLATPGQRRASWSGDLNPQAPVVTDRNAGPNTGDGIRSIHSATPGDWRGAVAWADNHCTFETDHRLDTRMGPSDRPRGVSGRLRFDDDHLFEPLGPDDVRMQHEP